MPALVRRRVYAEPMRGGRTSPRFPVRDKAVRRPRRSLYGAPISWRAYPPRFPMPSRPSFRRPHGWERNGTQGESADGRYGGFCGDRIGCRRFPWLPAGRADGRRERLAVRCLRLRLVLYVRRYQVLPAIAVVEAGRRETRLGTPGSRIGPRFVEVSKAVAFSNAGYPVRRNLSILLPPPVEYRITRFRG
jgi:hypothetical protein